ncbi:MAG TPA: M56 family metallopeptidase, partial [Sedimentisphaerales bacterium]|nr:M56 family metallopeptidase [Sedimentisphaerales bacterium]
MESLNAQLQPFIEWLLRTTVQASILICVILLLQRILRNRLCIRWHYSLWLLLLVRMLLPWAPQSRASLFNLIPRSAHQQQAEYEQQGNGRQSVGSEVAGSESVESVPASPAATTQESPDVVTATPSINQAVQNQLKPDFSKVVKILPLLWLIGALALAVYVGAGNFNLWRIVKRRRPLTDQKILDLLEDCKAQMGIQTILGIVPTDKVESPALFGFVRPRLLLPHGMIETLSRQELRYVLLHELAHLKRHDIYAGWLMSLLQILHWFNPLVWLAFYRMRSDRELACDALVLARTQSEEPKSYGRIIVNLVERFSRPQRLPGMAGILETKAQLKRRVTMIAKFKKNSYQWSPLAVILIITLACVSLPDARRTKASETAPSKTTYQRQFTKVQIPSKISWDAQLSPDGKEIAFGSEDKLWITPRIGKLRPNYSGTPRPLDTGGIPVERIGFAWSRDGQWIAFTDRRVIEEEGRKGNQRIYVVPAKGGEARQVHETNRHSRVVNYQMGLSPDGKTLAFSSFDAHEIYLETISVDGGAPRRLVEAPAREPAFSPDGRTIAYVENKKMGVEGGGLWTVPADGGAPTLVADANNASSPVWSADGSMIAFIDTGMGNQIYIVGVERDGKPAGEKFKVDPPEGTARVGRLAGWTTDNKIGVICAKKTQTALYSQPVQGGKAAFLTIGGGSQPRWSPDGKRVYHTKRANEADGDWKGQAIAYVPAEGGDVTTVPITSKDKITMWSYGAGIGVSPDGTTIIFAGQGAEENLDLLNIWTLPVEGGEPKRLTRPPAGFTDWYPCWSHDGQDIVFVREKFTDDWAKRQDRDIYIVTAKGGEPRKVTWESDRVYSAGPVKWSPDGKLLAFYSRDKDKVNGALCVVAPNGGGLKLLTTVESIYANKELAWSPDSRRIAFQSTKERVIKIVSLEDGGIEEIEVDLVDTKIYHLDWSPDGKNLVFAGYSGGGREFWMMENFLPEAPVAKPEPTTTLRQIEVRGRGSVHSRPSFDGKYMLDVDKETGNLVACELATGKERVLTKNSEPKRFVHGSLISRDSKKVAFYNFNPEKEDFDLRIVGLDGSGLRTLLGAEIAGYFNMDAWSPDGKYIFGKLMKK